MDEIPPTSRSSGSSEETVPKAIRAFIHSDDFEDALKTAVSLGDDSDA